MKKFLIGLVAISFGFIVTAAEVFDVKTTDKDVLLSCINAKNKNSGAASLILAMIEKNNELNTYEGAKNFYIKINNKKNNWMFYNVILKNQLFEKFKKDAWIELKSKNEYQYSGLKLLIFRNPKTFGFDIEKDECWYEIGKIITENKINKKKQLQAAIKFLIENDVKIPKNDRIKVYTEIYEQYLYLIIDEQNLQNNDKIITRSLSQISLKLKSLGVVLK
jgi:hypothetical protein